MNLEAFQLSGALHVADGSVGFNAHYRGRGEILYSAKLCFCFHCTFIDQLFSQGPLTVTCREESGCISPSRGLKRAPMSAADDSCCSVMASAASNVAETVFHLFK